MINNNNTLFILFVSTPGYFQPRMRTIVCVWGVQRKCSSSYSKVRFKWFTFDSAFCHWKTHTFEVEEICIKRLKTNLQSFWITKCFYSMQWFCCIHPNANNLCSKGTLCLWQKLNNLQNSTLSMIFREKRMVRGKLHGNCKALNLLLHQLCQACSMPTQIEEQGPQSLCLTASTEGPRNLTGLSHSSHQLWKLVT